MSELGTWSDCPGPLPLRPGWGFWLNGLSRVLARTGLYEGGPRSQGGGLIRKGAQEAWLEFVQEFPPAAASQVVMSAESI